MKDTPYVLVTDFDGTMTGEDFYVVAARRLLKPEDLRPWQEFRGGGITHFEAIRRIFSRIRAPEAVIDEILRDMRPDPQTAPCIAELKEAGWRVVVASAGCEWYVRRILDGLGVAASDIEVWANPGHYAPGGPLVMEENKASRFYCPQLGVDKAGIVLSHLKEGRRVAYCGDGVTDAPAARLVHPRLRFARRDLAEALAALHQPFRPFEVWSEVARGVLEEGDRP